MAGASGPGVLGELAELALGEKVDLEVVDDDARVVGADAVFNPPEFFAGFVGDGDGFAFSGDEVRSARGFDQDGEAFGRGKFGGVHGRRVKLDRGQIGIHRPAEGEDDWVGGRYPTGPGGGHHRDNRGLALGSIYAREHDGGANHHQRSRVNSTKTGKAVIDGAHVTDFSICEIVQ